MSFQQLWAPWRIGYITGSDKAESAPEIARKFAWRPGADQNCFLCRAVAEEAIEGKDQSQLDRQNLVVVRTERSIVVLNRFPYNNGHLLVAPLRHEARLDKLDNQENLDLIQTLNRFCAVLEQTMKPEGFNIGLNLGRIAGAGLPGHVHWHIVPRWNGDTNFMPVLAGVNVIPQSLESLLDVLQQALQQSTR